jgi:threonine dehydratase
MLVPTFEDVLAAKRRIAPFIQETPLLRSDVLDEATGAQVFVKAESLQRFGAFKARGAANAMASLAPQVRARGVVAFSSGNHAAAVAGMARAFKTKATIVMPSDAPASKINNTKALGAEVILYDRVREDREAIARAIAAEHGRPVIPPFEHPDVMAGQGTAGIEIAEALGAKGLAAEVGLVCCSGGGLAAGITIALQAANAAATVYAIEPVGHDDFARSLAAGERVANAPGIRSICDALMSKEPGALAFAVAQQRGMGALAVTDAEVKEAMRFAFRHLRLVLEPGGAAALAAALSGKAPIKGKVTAIIASGGNVDADVFCDVLSEA